MQEKLEKIFVKRFMVVDSSFLSSSLGFDLILRFSVTFADDNGEGQSITQFLHGNIYSNGFYT